MQQLRRQYREAITALEARLLAMGQMVLEMLDEALGALTEHDLERANRVVRLDDPLDAEYRAVQEDIFTAMALQAPVASELRFFIALTHTNIHIERMGDLCVNIAKFVRRVEGLTDDPTLLAELQEMGLHARRVLTKALEAFARRDVETACNLHRLDDPIDQLNKGLFKRLVQLAAEDESKLDWAVHAVLVTRYLERLGDHAVDVGDQVCFAVTGQAPPA